MLVVASFSFRLCVFTLNLSAEHSTGMSDASPLVPQAELPPSFIFMPWAFFGVETVLRTCQKPCTREWKLHDFFSFRVKRSFDFRGHFFISKFKFFFSKTFNIFLIFIQLDTLLLNVGMVKKMLFDSQTSFNLWSCKFIKANQYSENWLFLPTHFKQSVSRDQEISLLGKMSAFKDQWRIVTKRWEGYVRCLGQHTGRLLGPSRFLRRIYSSLHQFTLFIYEPFSLPI